MISRPPPLVAAASGAAEAAAAAADHGHNTPIYPKFDHVSCTVTLVSLVMILRLPVSASFVWPSPLSLQVLEQEKGEEAAAVCPHVHAPFCSLRCMAMSSQGMQHVLGHVSLSLDTYMTYIQIWIGRGREHEHVNIGETSSCTWPISHT